MSRLGLDPGGWQLACFQTVSVAPLSVDLLLFPVVVAWDIELSDKVKFYTLFSVLFWSPDMLLGFVTGYVVDSRVELQLSGTATRYLRTRLGTCCRLRCVMCAVCVVCVVCVVCGAFCSVCSLIFSSLLFSALLFLLLSFFLLPFLFYL